MTNEIWEDFGDNFGIFDGNSENYRNREMHINDKTLPM